MSMNFPVSLYGTLCMFLLCLKPGSQYMLGQALRPEVHTKWTRVAYTGIEIISIPAYAHVATRVQIILYALPVATLAQVYIVNQALV